MDTKAQVISILGGTSLTEEQKSPWLKRLEQEGATRKFLDELVEFLQEKIDESFDAEGVPSVDDDPEVKQAYKEMVQKLDAIDKEVAEETVKATKQIDQMQKQAVKDLDKAQADALSASIKS